MGEIKQKEKKSSMQNQLYTDVLFLKCFSVKVNKWQNRVEENLYCNEVDKVSK